MQTYHRPNRRQILLQGASAFGALSLSPTIFQTAQSAELERKRLLFFTKSSGFQHSVITREGTELAYAERLVTELGKKNNIDVTCSKDGRIFDKDYEQFDGFFFFTSLDLTTSGTDQQPPMTILGKKNLLESIAGGKGFAGAHAASDTFHSEGDRFEGQSTPDPYIQMIGGEFIRHGRQQEATMRIASSTFPGLPIESDSATKKSFRLNDEWYSLKNFAPDMHVILVQETEGMVDTDYKRPAYPATWARKHGQGRVFYTSMGHREDVWPNPIFESLLLGAFNWTLRRVEAEIPSNLETVCPKASTLPNLK
jgi:type 1 glutamine amidotransferase